MKDPLTFMKTSPVLNCLPIKVCWFLHKVISIWYYINLAKTNPLHFSLSITCISCADTKQDMSAPNCRDYRHCLDIIFLQKLFDQKASCVLSGKIQLFTKYHPNNAWDPHMSLERLPDSPVEKYLPLYFILMPYIGIKRHYSVQKCI